MYNVERMTANRPKRPRIGAVVRPLQEFLRLEAASGILLLLCALTALAWANVHGKSYRAMFDYPFAAGAGGSGHPFHSPAAHQRWVDDYREDSV